MNDTIQEKLGITLIPQPQKLTPKDGTFSLEEDLSIILPGDATAEDQFAAEDLIFSLKTEYGINTKINESSQGPVIRLSRRAGKKEGYRMLVTPTEVLIEGNDAAGLFWGTRTLIQSVRPESRDIPCMEIEDWPSIPYRMIHYDTKHHQGTYEYVQSLIRTLARYKVDVLVWEWEDKLAYERHPEIGAPGAFTKSEMQELSRYAQKHHMQIVPLVQGLGHVSYILKHPQHRHLREIPNSAWEFCPLKQESYDLLFDLWDEAMEATPGSEFLHIGTDETYELGLGEECGCKAKAEEIGREGLMKIFLDKSVAHIESRGRRAISWGGRYRPDSSANPPKSMITISWRDPENVKTLKEAGYDSLVYAPNPGIEPLVLTYFPWVQHSMWRPDVRRVRNGSFWDTSQSIATAGKTGLVLGSITTSWDDSGLHTQAWVPRFICAAEFSWNSSDLDVNIWVDRFFNEYFGKEAKNMRELFQTLQESATFYYHTFQRCVWHWGDVGKIHIPDFPRQELEYHPFWCSQYAQLLHRAAAEKQRLQRSLWIIEDNLSRDIRNRYDLEIYRTCTNLMLHNVNLVLMLGELEEAIGQASKEHFSNRQKSLALLESARKMIEENLAEREQVFNELVEVWERTRLPKGMSTPDKPFVFAPDRARHFANRTPDMKYLIMDEELLGLEDHLQKLTEYIEEYKANIDS